MMSSAINLVRNTVQQHAASTEPPAQNSTNVAQCFDNGKWVKLPSKLPLLLVHAMTQWHGKLWVAGLGGVVKRASAQQWLTHNDGLLPPQWSNLPHITAMADHGDDLWIIQGNAGPQNVLRRSPDDNAWMWQSDAPHNARTFLTATETLYLGGEESVAQWDDVSQSWWLVAPTLDAAVTALAQDESASSVIAGSKAGALWLIDPATQSAWLASPSLDGSAIRTMRAYGDAMYVATLTGLFRCVDAVTQCDAMTSATAILWPDLPTALAVWNDTLLLSTSSAAYAFNATADAWTKLSSGFSAYPTPITALESSTRLLAAKAHKIWRWQCQQ